MSSPSSASPAPRRQLSLLDCFGIGINGILGSGIFLLPAALHRRAGGMAPLSWLLVGGLCALVALCFAEAAARTDRSGGPYRYACDAFGTYVGFAIGWITLISSVFGYAAVARGFGQNAAQVLGSSGSVSTEVALGALVVILLAGVNIMGVRLGARLGDGISAVKLLSLLLFIGIGMFFVSWANLHAAPHPDLPGGERAGILGAAFAGLFATTGFEYIPVPAGEAKDPRRTIPLAMVVSVLGATVLYMLVQIVAAGTNPELGSSHAALADSAARFGGLTGRKLMGLAGTVSAFGFCTGSALVGPRYLESFAQDRFLPKILTYRSPRLGTPVVAILALSGLVLTMLLLLRIRFESLADISNVAVVIQYMATCSAVLVLRRRSPPPPGAFVVPFGSLVPVLALLGSCVFLRYVGLRELWVAGGFIVAGLAFGGLFRRLSGRGAELG